MSLPISHLKDRDMQAAPLALLRAANKARCLATQTGTPWVVRPMPVPTGVSAKTGPDAVPSSDTMPATTDSI